MVDVPYSKLPVAGSLTGEEIVMISQLSASVAISGTTISAQASDNSFNDSGSGFVTAGFAVNDYVHVVGFTGDTANNIFSGKITALTAGKMTIGGTDGDVIVDDAAGETVTITKWESGRLDLTDLPGNIAVVSLQVSDPNGSAISTGDGAAYWRVPSTLDGWNLVAVAAALTTASSSGDPTVQIANATGAVDMLTTKLSIDASETDSGSAATPAVIDTANDDVATGDQLRIDIDVAGTGAKGLMVELQFQRP